MHACVHTCTCTCTDCLGCAVLLCLVWLFDLVALKLLVSLISRLVAYSARIVADKQTIKQTDTQNDYCNPRCACVPRVNN